MNEIKVRAWDGKRMFDPKCPCGFVFCDPAKATANGLVLTLFTGIRDRHGNDLYVGDIIKDHDTGYVGELLFHDGELVMVNRPHLCGGWAGHSALRRAPKRNIELIGNRFEHPELLATSTAHANGVAA